MVKKERWYPVQMKRSGKFHVKTKRQWTGNQLRCVSFSANSNANSYGCFYIPHTQDTFVCTLSLYAASMCIYEYIHTHHIHIYTHTYIICKHICTSCAALLAAAALLEFVQGHTALKSIPHRWLQSCQLPANISCVCVCVGIVHVRHRHVWVSMYVCCRHVCVCVASICVPEACLCWKLACVLQPCMSTYMCASMGAFVLVCSTDVSIPGCCSC